MGSVLGRIDNEAPNYELLQRSLNDNWEVRRYPPCLTAYTFYTEAEGTSPAFRRIAGFIFGGNQTKESVSMTVPVQTEPKKTSESIAMTVPVATEGDERNSDGKRVMRFFMPSKYSLETLPTPNDPEVHIEMLPEKTVATITYSGDGKSYFDEQRILLESHLKEANIEIIGEASLLQYNPPWTLSWMRTNEILIPCRLND